MRLKFFSLPAVLVVTACAIAAGAQEQPQDEVVRGAFVTTRPGAKKEEKKETTPAAETDAPTTHQNGTAKTASNPPARRKGAGAKGKTGTQVAGGSATAKTDEAAAREGSKTGLSPAGIGLGYTLFLRGASGGAQRVSPAREFSSGEAIRLLVESNTDGYLYIFDAENDSVPQLIFPNARLNRGDNHIGSHVPYEIPSAKEADDNLRWFVFNDTPATERVYVVVSRVPLEGVPAGEALVRACAESEQTCAWKPSAEQWAALKTANARDQVAVSRAKDDGRALEATEHEAATRGLGLSADAPLPSVIYMVASSNANVLVTTVDLIHK
ncbi:MAG: DUF4384 domain-containing protein [Pyrinomonadaceae bacterium]